MELNKCLFGHDYHFYYTFIIICDGENVAQLQKQPTFVGVCVDPIYFNKMCADRCCQESVGKQTSFELMYIY